MSNGVNEEKMTREYQKQNNQYSFPYHHIPHMDTWRGHSFPSMDRYLWFGFEYLGYNQYIIDKLMRLNLESVMDLGCGDGRFLQLLAEKLRGDKNRNNRMMKMMGIDISEEAIVLAKALNEWGGIEYRALDISDVEEKFDCITCIETLEHIPDESVSGVIANIYRCLNPGGMAIICVPSINRPKEEKHFRHYDEAELKREILDSQTDFEIVKIEYFWKKDSFTKYLMATSNRFLYIRFRLLDNILWKRAFKADSRNGAHIIMTLRK